MGKNMMEKGEGKEEDQLILSVWVVGGNFYVLQKKIFIGCVSCEGDRTRGIASSSQKFNF